MSTAVTMRPRRLSTPATQLDASGTRVIRSGMNTSCTREIGSPNSWPPIMAVTYSVMVSSEFFAALLMSWLSCRLVDLGGLFLQRGDQAGPVEFCDVIMETRLAAALDRGGRHHRRQRDDRHRIEAVIGLDGLGELETVHVGHFDVGQDGVE